MLLSRVPSTLTPVRKILFTSISWDILRSAFGITTHYRVAPLIVKYMNNRYMSKKSCKLRKTKQIENLRLVDYLSGAQSPSDFSHLT